MTFDPLPSHVQHARSITRHTRSASIRVMTGDRRKAFGRLGEDLAASHLERQGWRIVERNYRTREGELDLIVARAGTLAFCEVKTLVRRGFSPVSGPTNPVECVGPAKRSKVRRMARAWLAQHRRGPPSGSHRELRLDVIGVTLGPDGTLVRLDHLENAF